MNATRFGLSRVGMGLGMAAVVAALGMAPATAKADRWGVSVSLGREPVWVPPVYEARERLVSTPATYEERTQRVWREPVYETRRVMVEIPARTAIREVPRYDRFGRRIGCDRVVVVVEPARREWRTERVLVQPGRWETMVERVCARPEHNEVVHDNVLVSPGYWQQTAGLAFGYERGHGSEVRVVAGSQPWGPGHHAAVRVRR